MKKQAKWAAPVGPFFHIRTRNYVPALYTSIFEPYITSFATNSNITWITNLFARKSSGIFGRPSEGEDLTKKHDFICKKVNEGDDAFDTGGTDSVMYESII